MNWDAIGAIAELVGALAVVLTLAYLARQIKQNSLSMRVAAKQEMTRQYCDFADQLLVHKDLFELQFKGRTGQVLNEEESYKYFLLVNKATWYFSAMFYQYRVHELSKQDWSQSKRVIERYCAMPGYQNYWKENREYWPDDFTQYMDELVRRAA